jgi:hypothetical protein
MPDGEVMPGGTDPEPEDTGGSPVALFVYVEDGDDIFKRATEAGGQAVQEPRTRRRVPPWTS